MTIRPQARNANRHTQRGMAALETSIATDGWIGAITVAADGETFDGSARVEKTAENGMLDDPIVLDIDGTRPVVLRRTDIPSATDPRAVRLGVAANRIGSLNLEWEPDVLAAIADSGVDLGSLFTDVEWAEAALPTLPEAADDAPVSVDETKPTRCQAGDVWRVGRHTVACVDSTDRATVERLIAGRKVGMVVADPPYGISAVDPSSGQTGGLGRKGFRGYAFGGVNGTGKGIKNNKYAPIAGDDSSDTAERAAVLVLELLPNALHFWWGANNYANVLPPTTCWIVWDKETDANFADAELAWSNHEGAVRMFRHKWSGMLKASEQGQTRIHPTQKPVALFSWLYNRYGSAGDTIFDPFLGSSPSLKAAEQSGRTVVGCELSPHYVDHIIEWAEAEGLECTRID